MPSVTKKAPYIKDVIDTSTFPITNQETEQAATLTKEEILAKYFERAPAWAQNPILIGLRGSDAHGTKILTGVDDLDIFAIVVQPMNWYMGLEAYHAKYDCINTNGEDLDIEIYDIRKFCHLAAKSNPNCICWLWNRPEDYLLITSAGQMLLDNRNLVLSKEAFPRLKGYAMTQLDKMHKAEFQGYMGEKRKKLVIQHGYDTKFAAHALRLFLMGYELYEKGTFHTYRPENEIELLKDIKEGKYSLAKFTALMTRANDLFNEYRFNPDAPGRSLPAEVDYERMSELCIEVILQHGRSAT